MNVDSPAVLIMGFSLLRGFGVFVFRKMEMPEIINHLLCGWCSKMLIAQSPFRSIIGVSKPLL